MDATGEPEEAAAAPGGLSAELRALAPAHVGLALFALFAAVLSLTAPPLEQLGTDGRFQFSAGLALVLGCLYLVATACQQAYEALRLQQNRCRRASRLVAATHLAIAVAACFSLLQGARSRMLLAQAERLPAALLAVSLLAVGLAVATDRASRSAGSYGSSAARPGAFNIALIVAGLLVAAAICWLEMLPLPGSST